MSTFPTNKALELLRGESQGFAIDATTEGGSIAVKDATTKANNHLISGVTTDFRNGLDSANNVRAGAVKLINSGTSPKVVLKADGTLGWSPHNYCRASQTFDNGTYWQTDSTLTVTANAAVAPDGTLTADKLIPDTDSGAHVAYQGVTSLVSGAKYTDSVYMKAAGYGYGVLIIVTGSQRYTATVSLSDGTVTDNNSASSPVDPATSVTDAGGGWWRVAVSMESTDTTVQIAVNPSPTSNPSVDGGLNAAFTGDGTSGIYVWGAQVNRGTVPVPHLPTTTAVVIGIPQTYDAVAEEYGILVEPAATNVITASQSIDIGLGNWDDQGVLNSSLDATTAPDGTVTADKLIESAGAGDHQMFTGSGLSSGAVTISIYAKAAERSWIHIKFYDGSTYATFFDLTNGVVGTNAGGSTATITAIGNGWYRCTASRTIAGSLLPLFGMASADNTSSYIGDGTSGAYFWGAQCETGTFATSYIPTLASTVTRAVDNVGAVATGFPLSTTAHTFIVKAKSKETVGNPYFVTLEGGSFSELIGIREANTSINFIMLDGGVEQMNANSTNVIAVDTSFCAGIAAAANDGAGSLDGGAVVMDGSITMPTPTDMKLVASTASPFIEHVIYLPRRATNGELQWMTAGDTHLLASLLLDGENNGLACDFTESTGVGAVSVKDQTTAANIKYNTAADNFWTNAGTSPKIVRTSSGTVRWSPHNLISAVDSEVFSGWSVGPNGGTVTSNATTAPNGTLTADEMVSTGNNNDFYRSAAFTAVAGFPYCLSIYAKQSVEDFVFLQLSDNIANAAGKFFDLVNGTVGASDLVGSGTILASGIENAGNGWWRCWIVSPAIAGTSYHAVHIAEADNDRVIQTSDSIYVWGGQVNRGYTPTAYIKTTSAARIGCAIDYDGTEYGLLVEPAATNICLQSEDFSTTWTNSATTETTNSTTAPDGTTTADTIVTSNTTNCIVRQDVATGRVDNGTHTFSVYAKKGTSNFLIMVDNYIGTAGAGAWFNLNTGAVGTVQAGATASIVAVGNGWYRCSIYGTNSSATITLIDCYVADADNSTNVTNGNTIFLWGAQLETGTVATSYIPTLGSTVTRAQDLVKAQFTTFPTHGTTALSLYVDYELRQLTGSDNRLLSVNPSDNTKYMDCINYNTTTTVTWSVTAAGSGVVSTSLGSGITANTRQQESMSMAVNDFAASHNGGAISQDTSCAMPGAPTDLALGSSIFDFGSSAPIVFRRFVHVPRKVANADLPTWRYEV